MQLEGNESWLLIDVNFSKHHCLMLYMLQYQTKTQHRSIFAFFLQVTERNHAWVKQTIKIFSPVICDRSNWFMAVYRRWSRHLWVSYSDVNKTLANPTVIQDYIMWYLYIHVAVIVWIIYLFNKKKISGKATGVTGLKYFPFSDPLPLVLLLVHR